MPRDENTRLPASGPQLERRRNGLRARVLAGARLDLAGVGTELQEPAPLSTRVTARDGEQTPNRTENDRETTRWDTHGLALPCAPCNRGAVRGTCRRT